MLLESPKPPAIPPQINQEIRDEKNSQFAQNRIRLAPPYIKEGILPFPKERVLPRNNPRPAGESLIILNKDSKPLVCKLGDEEFHIIMRKMIDGTDTYDALPISSPLNQYRGWQTMVELTSDNCETPLYFFLRNSEEKWVATSPNSEGNEPISQLVNIDENGRINGLTKSSSIDQEAQVS